MNEFLFFLHIGLLLGATRISLRIGRSALVSLVVLQTILSNLFLPKQIILFGLTLTPTDAYALSALVGVNLIQEYFGKEAAKRLVRLNFFVLIFFTTMAMIQVAYHPAACDDFHGAFKQILDITPRIFLSSIASYYLSQRIDVELFSSLRKTRSRMKAMMMSMAISQAFDTVLFSLLALSGVVQSVVSIIFVSYFIKMITLISIVPFTKLFPKKEQITAVK